MILLRDKRLLFIKGAKVAGTSIEVLLAAHAGPEDIVTPISPPSPRHIPRNFAGPGDEALYYNHIDASSVRALLGFEYFQALRRFGVVRNPIEKVKSTFAMQYVLTEGRYDIDRAIEDTWSEQDKYCDADGSLLLTHVLLYEDLDAGLRQLLGEVGIAFDRLEINEKADYRKRCPIEAILDPRHRARIAEKFAWEFRNFYGHLPEAGFSAAPRASRNLPGDANMGRKHLTDWQGDPESMTLQNLDTWHLGGDVHVVPNKQEFARTGIASLLEGWIPAEPLIRADTRVIGVGSCFASYFVLWLAENGFNRTVDGSPYNALMRYGASFESPGVIAQQFRWAFDEFDGRDALWIGKEKELFEANEERRALVRETLERTDVLILTLGLSELWYDSRTGEPLWRALTRRHYDPARHVFRVESLEDTKRHLAKIEDIRRRHLPGMRIVYTVSPVRLKATFRPISAITANSVSKAILRAALDEFLRENQERLNRELFYFPSYEIVHDYFRDPFEEDNRHVAPYVASQVVQAFARHYCSAEMLERMDERAASTGDPKLDSFLAFGAPRRDVLITEYTARVTDLERQVQALQTTCDERQGVIIELERVAHERLELVERLHGECARLQRQVGS